MQKVLVANRGEIACRIIAALKKLSITSVAVYTEVDKESLHVKYADEAICIGASNSKDSYLNISRIIAACEISGADAVHPGYGFLSENALFAEIIEQSGLIFIGPSSSLIKSLGNKIEAKKLAARANCPTIAGSTNAIDTVEVGLARVLEIGYPVLIKASAGGGGKGIRIAETDEEFRKGYIEAKSEALVSFGDDTLYVEKMIQDPKHIEVQIAADHFGSIIHLYERDCSIQRRRQKLIEETLSPSIDEEQRIAICSAAVALMREAGYNSLGTVEFLLDKNGNFYFMEVNARIQVEHTITEELTGIDLVAMQINIARGERLPISQKDVQPSGCVMQFRINAEDPDNLFQPSPGFLDMFIPPLNSHVRVDTALYQGISISPYYDSMIAKVIVRGRDREEVIENAKIALRQFTVVGVKTTIPFHLKILEEDIFINNHHHILSIDNMTEQGCV